MSSRLRLMAVACLVAGCTSHSAFKAPGVTTTRASATTLLPTTTARPEASLVAPVVVVEGDLAPEQKDRIPDEAGYPIDQFVRRAYLHGGDRASAFSLFTPGAAAQAEIHRDVLTAPEPDLWAEQYQAFLTVFGRDGLPQGAQAELTMTAASPTTLLTVVGTLDLVPTPDGWRIFGFALTTMANGEETATVTSR